MIINDFLHQISIIITIKLKTLNQFNYQISSQMYLFSFNFLYIKCMIINLLDIHNSLMIFQILINKKSFRSSKYLNLMTIDYQLNIQEAM